ncbi:hypothetical protein GW933_04420 [Candidatus Falkowbacteria bacterium]|uniref:Uncharacterized protein n=1 Tax=Candidatus Buchananbacteria bacterium CG10_big_fil_rev_8_21_14_0_10_33_19 TaxID=1974525 RepID=A0A2H0W4Z1_9BACT|nr:hypothetical protein [Candidatus Falkowbacteria bacterium]PIS06423.1 MAG: hypothetical protein COT80_00570 [Candidatus Buchananbacteria bacterium CG10_big_fil_rev_8_21_14_0_10_33_19]
MLVNYFKSKNISRRSKVIALSVVGGVFILVSLLAIWQRNFADTLINYVASDVNFYVHFSRPKINSSNKIDGLLDKILFNFGLPGYESLDIDREVSIVGRLDNNVMKYGVIFKTDRPSRVKKILKSNNIEYKTLSYNRFLVADSNWLNVYTPDQKNIIKSSIVKRFHPFSSINIYASKLFLGSGDDLNLGITQLLLRNENSDIILSFKAKGDGLRLYYGGISSVVGSYSAFEVKNLKDKIDGDIVFLTTNFSDLLNNWKNNLQTTSSSDYQSFIDSKLAVILNTYLPIDSHNVFVLANKKADNSGWLFGDYDFYVVVENIYSGKIEEILKTIMANRYPVAKSVYLSDGTRVLELLPDISQFSFLDRNGVMYLDSPDNQFKLMYKSVDNKIIISNNEYLMNQNWLDRLENGNYLKFNTSLVADNSFTDYVKIFNSLEITEKGLILR